MHKEVEVKPAEFAQYWANELGCKSKTIARVSGGVNNLVYRCGSQGGWIIKQYRKPKGGERDRMKAEVEFLRYANEVAGTYVPNLYIIDKERRCIILEELKGRKFDEKTKLYQSHLEHAAWFIESLNRDKVEARRKIRMRAGDGFFKVTDHLKNVKHRLSRLEWERLSSGYQVEAKPIVKMVEESFAKVIEETEALVRSGILVDKLDEGDRIVSPSDFGYHNALWSGSSVFFIDFEFAGWDDPTKTVVDFIFQPKVPVDNANLLGKTILSLSAHGLRSQFKVRCNIMARILELKWLCIILNVLDMRRLEEVNRVEQGKTSDEILTERLMTARLQIDLSEKLQGRVESMCNYAEQ
jgi:tRNA A-37 threonylcarbamoyl transferase component Bud32